MKTAQFFSEKGFSFNTSLFLFICAIALVEIGCGNPSSAPPTFSGSTNVTVMLTSTANDEFSEFGLTFNNITLTDKDGKKITVLANSQGAEFLHLNGIAEPLITASIPQGIYTSATASIGYAYFTCVTLIPSTGTPPNGLLVATYAYGSTPDGQVSVSVPSSITITGDNMGLVFNMDVSQSASLEGCYQAPGSLNAYSITPTFTVTPVHFSSQQNASFTESSLNAEVSSVDTGKNNFDVTLPDGQALTVSVDGSTAYYGVNKLSDLATGMFITLDGTIRADGSQLATRISSEDIDTTNTSVSVGPVIQTNPLGPTGSGPTAFVFSPQHQGLFTENNEAAEVMAYKVASARFQVSNGLSNLQDLPFVPNFSSSTMVPGQNVYLTTHASELPRGDYLAASTLALYPQTINGTVVASSNTGGFTVYTVALAPYDLFPALAVQPGQQTLLTNPSLVFVYLDGNTRLNNSTVLTTGNTFRFRGLVFNDNGTLRMDCAQVNDGVSTSAVANTRARSRAITGNRSVQYMSKGQVQQIITVTTPNLRR